MSVGIAPGRGIHPRLRASGTLPRGSSWYALTGSWAAAGAFFALLAVAGVTARFSVAGALVSGTALAGVLLWLLSRIVEGPRRAKDRLVTAAVSTAFVIAVSPLVSLLWTVVANGAARFDITLFTHSMRGVIGGGGGALHAITGTLLITGATVLISVPVGVLAAIHLVEYRRTALSKAITFFVDVMTGIPSIVAGLFVFALFALVFGPAMRNGMMGALALSVLMIPVVVRSSEEVLRLVPADLREASYALGVPRWATILRVVLPTAATGIVTGVMLAIARVIGETAPLLLVAGFTFSMNHDLFEGRMMTLPVFVYTQYTQAAGAAAQASIDRAWAAALTLILIVMALNLLGRMIARVFAPRTR